MTIESLIIPILTLSAVAVVACIIVNFYRHICIVQDGFAGLLYHYGQLVGTLTAGRHIRWGRNYRLAFVDLRRTLLNVAGQEVLTSDNVGVKISVVLTLQITDAAKSVRAADNQTTFIYSAAQTAVRTAVSGLTIEALLKGRAAIGNQLLEIIAPQAEAVGSQLHAVDVRDVMLPGELRKAFSEVLKARQEGQAALERARGESASLRNMVNAAHLIEGHPALTTLRFLQTLESTGSNHTVVLNDLSSLLNVPTARGGKQKSGLD